MKPLILLGFVLAAAFRLSAAEPGVVYSNDFEKLEPGKLPDEFMVIDGGFMVREDGGNKFLELPGAPLDTFGTLFGPVEKDGLCVSARIFGTSQGRRFPTFSVGVNGVGGYKLQVSPAKKMLELYRGENLKTNAPVEWTSGKWTHLKLQMHKIGEGKWKVEGKVWADGQAEPAVWAITFEDAEEPPAGRSSVWGSPYSTTPIRFDDLNVTKTSGPGNK